MIMILIIIIIIIIITRTNYLYGISWWFDNLYFLEDFRYMKIHIFALRWRDEIRRSSQLRTLLKLVVVNRT